METVPNSAVVVPEAKLCSMASATAAIKVASPPETTPLRLAALAKNVTTAMMTATRMALKNPNTAGDMIFLR